MEDIQIIILIALFVNGLHYICYSGNNMIFSFVGRWYEGVLQKRRESFNEAYKKANGNIGGKTYQDQIDKHVYKYDDLVAPIFGCYKCMTSVWGTAIYFIFGDFNFVHWPFIIIAATGLSIVVYANGPNKIQ